MINSSMRPYNYFTFGEKNAYGERVLSEEPVGSIKISINLITQAIADNVNYSQATYLGLTRDTKVNDTYVIEYEGKKLKVLYINTQGRLKQVYMAEV